MNDGPQRIVWCRHAPWTGYKASARVMRSQFLWRRGYRYAIDLSAGASWRQNDRSRWFRTRAEAERAAHRALDELSSEQRPGDPVANPSGEET